MLTDRQLARRSAIGLWVFDALLIGLLAWITT